MSAHQKIEWFFCSFDRCHKPTFARAANPEKLSRTQKDFIFQIGAGLDSPRRNAGGAQKRMAWSLFLAGLIRNCDRWTGAATVKYGVELTPAGNEIFRKMKTPKWLAPGSVK